MKQCIQIECPSCHHDDLVKNGHSEHGTQRYRGKDCQRSFQWEYTYRAWLPETKAQIEEQPLNGSGVRDISRHLGIAKDTVMAELKKKRLQRETSPSPSSSPKRPRRKLTSIFVSRPMSCGVMSGTNHTNDGHGMPLNVRVAEFWPIRTAHAPTRRVNT